MIARIHICHAIASLARSGGGTSAFVGELANAQAKRPGNRVTVVTSARTDDEVLLAPQVARATWPSIAVADWLDTRRRAGSLDLLHVHALWLPFVHRFLHEASRIGIPVVLSTHGMLAPHALRLKRWKKHLALLAYQRRDLHAVDFLHATALPEAAHLRAFGLRQPIIVVPPGLDLPSRSLMHEWSAGTPRTALFFSRVHPIKNLCGLLDAWAAVRPAGWILRIVGPDDNGHGTEVQSRIRMLGLGNTVTVAGAAYGADKSRLFQDASLFVLPSFTENFGIVVAEALAHGVPVIATHGTPWQCVADTGCGWWVDSGHDSLAAALAEATAAPLSRLQDMGLRGRRLVEERFQWASVAESMQAAYSWALGRGTQPDCVIL